VTMRARTLLAIAVLAASALASTSARAADDDDKKRGHQAMMDMNYSDALAAYQKALAQNPSDASLHYNIGRAHQAREEYPEALDALTEFDKRASPEVRAKVPALAQLLLDVRARVGTIRLRCTVAVPSAKVSIGDRVRIDGCPTEAQVVRFSVPPGKRPPVEVRLEDEKYLAPTARIVVDGGAAPVDVTLGASLKDSSGTLRVRATPSTAVVSVDGVERGNPPLEVALPAGQHVIDLTADRYESRHVPFVLRVGEKKDLDLALDRAAPITSKWWFWTGAGVLVAGAVAATVILVVQPEREPASGSIAPGTHTTSFGGLTF
jgi:PEGA domain/TPR repeat